MATSGPLALTGRPPIQQRIWAAASNETNLPTEWFLFLRQCKSVKSHDIAIFHFFVFVFMYFVLLSGQLTYFVSVLVSTFSGLCCLFLELNIEDPVVLQIVVTAVTLHQSL